MSEREVLVIVNLLEEIRDEFFHVSTSSDGRVSVTNEAFEAWYNKDLTPMAQDVLMLLKQPDRVPESVQEAMQQTIRILTEQNANASMTKAEGSRQARLALQVFLQTLPELLEQMHKTCDRAEAGEKPIETGEPIPPNPGELCEAQRAYLADLTRER